TGWLEPHDLLRYLPGARGSRGRMCRQYRDGAAHGRTIGADRRWATREDPDRPGRDRRHPVHSGLNRMSGRSGVIVVGSVHTDLIASADAMPMPGSSVLGTRFTLAPGGKAGNQA